MINYQLITFIVGMLGVIFTVYNYFRTPQETLDKKQEMDKKDMDGKAALLALQVAADKEFTEKRFSDLGARITDSMTLAQNHIHTLDIKMDKAIESMNSISIHVATLATIINERIPKKND